MSACIVIVQFDLPGRSAEQARASGLASAPTYRALRADGLVRKDYLNGDAGTGGVYLWESRAAAEAWFTEERLESLAERFGASVEQVCHRLSTLQRPGAMRRANLAEPL